MSLHFLSAVKNDDVRIEIEDSFGGGWDFLLWYRIQVSYVATES